MPPRPSRLSGSAPLHLLSLLLTGLILGGCSDDDEGKQGSMADAGPADAAADDANDNPDGAIAVDGGACSVDADCPALADPCLTNHCTQGQCVVGDAPADTPCDDGKACTGDDKCAAGGQCAGILSCGTTAVCEEAYCDDKDECASKNATGPCDDGNACTTNDHCQFKACLGDAVASDFCDDDNDCTEDLCSQTGGCGHTPASEGKACFDGDACTVDDSCDSASKCVAGTPLSCDDGKTCTLDKCDKADGCVFPPITDGTTCDDDSKCTHDDACAQGKCKGVLIPEAQPKSACEQILCDPVTTKITVAPAPDGTACSDGEACTVGDGCAQGVCKGQTLQCNVGDPCKSYACDPATGMCVGTPVQDGTACSDANACTIGDTCTGGKCVGKDYQLTDTCDDDNSCTNDGCAPLSGCFHVPKTGACDDGDLCTEPDVCAGGLCNGGDKACTDNNPCTHDSCDKISGKCVHTEFVGPCDDNDPCTGAEQCVDGKCSGAKVVCDDDNSCTTDLCDSKSGCAYLPKAGGSPCDDGCGCTTDDICDGGKCKGKDQCVGCNSDLDCLKLEDGNPCNGILRCEAGGGQCGAPKVCVVDPKTVIICGASSSECAASLCDPKTGSCDTKYKPAGSSCNTANKCVTGQACTADGGCEGKALDCDDGNPCTVDSCAAAVGCIHAPKADKTACDDGNPCTKATTCLAGTCIGKNSCQCKADADCEKYDDGDKCNGLVLCKGGLCQADHASKVTCPALKGQACKANVCDAASGQCAAVPAGEGAKCDDGDACSLLDTCKGGVCEPSGTADCNDGVACTVDVCDKAFGCANAPLSDGAKCDDGAPCTVKDSCLKGECAGTLLKCDDGNPCTIDVCDKAKGQCAVIVAPDAECNDDNPCTTDDTCKDGACVASAMECSDGNDCTIDACDGQGGCKHVQVPGKDCDDQDVCSFGDHCDEAGKCVGKGQSCDDGNSCTLDKCSKGQCAVVPLGGQPCDDDDKCTEQDACDNLGACKAVPVNCDDGSPCTAVVGPCTAKNGCAVVPNDGKLCTDGEICTTGDICQGGACQGVKMTCDDDNPCTLDECVSGKGCLNKANTCDDANDCTFDKCDPPKSPAAPKGTGKGCVHAPIDGLKGCSDGDACTEDGACQGDKCSVKLKSCDDDDPCTTDSCVADVGCANLPDASTATACDDGDACTTNTCDGKGKCGSVKVDCDDANPCTQDSCHKLKGCITADLADKVGCEDDDPCTKDTVCQGGFCSGGVVTCPLCPQGTDAECAIFDDNDKCNGTWKCVLDGGGLKGGKCVQFPDPVVCDSTGDGACLKNRCSSLTGTCAMTEQVNGSPCDDGIRCTVGDTCQNGGCMSGVKADCSALADDCNVADCLEDPSVKAGYSCVQLPKAGTVICDADDDGCTAQDTCANGVCKPGKKVDCDGVGGACTVSSCVSSGKKNFTCKTVPAKEFAPCEDGQACTGGDFCQGGKCQPGLGKIDCGSLDSDCATGICDPKANGGAGACMPLPKNEGKGCNADDNGCTVKDICVSGMCVPGALPNCSAKSSACALGACQPQGQTYICLGTPVNEAKPCEADNDGCTVGDRCQAGACQPGKAMDCSAKGGNGGCLVGTCVSIGPAQGDCTTKPAQLGTLCDADNNGCTVEDACNADGACMTGQTVDCLAFAGSCATGACTSTGPKTFTCAGSPKPDGSKCDADGNGCTVGDVCAKGVCVPGEAPDCSKEAKGACIAGGCKSKGSDQYLCQPAPKSDGASCDADGDGCTKGDACVGGLCAKGAQVTCVDFQGFCASAVCQSLDAGNSKCQVTPKESYPPLVPPKPCKPSDKPDKCPAGYDCITVNAQLDEGECSATKTVSCDDGDGCTEGDICSQGSCAAGALKTCDDGDGCSLDACIGSQCSHKPSPGCVKCLDEGWEDTVAGKNGALSSTDWVAWSRESKYVAFGITDKNTWAGSKQALRVKWKGPGDDPVNLPRVQAWLVHRRLYLDEGVPATLAFRLQTKFDNQSCTFDSLQVLINNQVIWERCEDSKEADLVDGWERIALDLSAWRGAAIDIEFRVTAATGPTALGTIDIDAITLTGACGPGCLGVDFEDRRRDIPANKPEPPRIPQPWKMAATAPAFAEWKADHKFAHTGKTGLTVSYAGAQPGGKSQEAAFTVPELTPAAGDVLHYALAASGLGDLTCSGDVLEVSIGGQVVDQRCSEQVAWKVHAIKLDPWQGKTIDVRFAVKSAAGATAKGSFSIDDVAVSGGCTYTCFRDDFDAGGLNGWATTSQDAANLRFELSKTTTKSAPNSVLGWHNKFAATAKVATVIAQEAKGGRFLVPVIGASFRYHANIFLDKSVCAVNPADEPGTPVNVALQVVDEPFPEIDQQDDGAEDTWTVGSACESTAGWQMKTGPLEQGSRGRLVVPAIELRKDAKITEMKAYFDSLQFICK